MARHSYSGVVASLLSQSTPITSSTQPFPPISRSDVTSLIIGTVSDLQKRKKNVVISGVPEMAGRSDMGFVTDLLVNQLHLCSAPTVLSVSRLGRNVGSSRKILVRLASETAASSILQAGRGLRHSTDPLISSKIFINADLSMEEAKLAFDRRVARSLRPLGHPVPPAPRPSGPSGP